MKAIFITPKPVKAEQRFESIMWLRTAEMIGTLKTMGVEVLNIEFEAAGNPCDQTISSFQTFNPNFVIAPNFNYFLAATVSPKNLFCQSKIPLVALWDDPMGALANHLWYVANNSLTESNNTPRSW